MPRKLFRKFLPSHDSIRENRYVAWCGPWLQHHNLWLLHRRSVAGGVAAGLFAGLVPGSNPVQFLVAALLAIAFRVNLPIAAVVTLYSNPFTVVPLYYVAFKLGQLAMLGDEGDVPSIALALEGKSIREWVPAVLEWIADVGYPLLIGLPLLALLLAAIGYVVTDQAWRLHVKFEWRRRQMRRTQSTSK
ncbi:MAG TPA: DUF2062 domain-containing protein [Burkholderiales bacterium]|jgi:uncharacterized protein|nr:DUF2062 domain-containing protein [Burkholderiales bacterium]